MRFLRKLQDSDLPRLLRSCESGGSDALAECSRALASHTGDRAAGLASPRSIRGQLTHFASGSKRPVVAQALSLSYCSGSTSAPVRG